MSARGPDILLIGGSAEARALAEALQGRACVILPEPERQPHAWPVPVLPFIDAPDTLAASLGAGVRGLVDASHPNDWRASELACACAAQAGLPLLRLERPPWRPGKRDRWHRLRRPEDAARVIRPGARVFLATGRETLMAFARLKDVYVVARQITAHADRFPLPRGRFLKGAAPFSVSAEAALLRRLGIDWLVLRNAGGAGGWPKLEAARRLGLRVAMIDRPRLPPAPVVRGVDAALEKIAAWTG